VNQLALFPDIAAPAHRHDLVGLHVILPGACRHCGSHAATIGAGKAMHKAALFCECGRHGGWMSNQSFNFVSEIVSRFGRPTEPIVVRTPKAGGAVEAGHSTQSATAKA
jgi:hypothetical protein